MAVSEPLSMRTIFKFTLPLMGIFMTSVLLWGDKQKAWAIFPALLITLYISAADIRIEGTHIYYRYFFSWKKLPNDIADVRCTFLPALGCIRFKHFAPPFGILFFIVERGSGGFFPLRRIDLMQGMPSSHLRQDGSPSQIDSDTKGKELNRKVRILYPVAGLMAGMLISVPWQHWIPPINHSFFSYYFLIQQNPLVLCLSICVLIVFIIRNKTYGLMSFGLAFMAGTIVAYLTHIR